MDGLGVIVHQLLLAFVARDIERSFRHNIFILGKNVDDFDVLVHCPSVVVQACERRNQSAAKRGDACFAIIGGERRVAKQRDFLEIELLQPLLIAGLGVSVGYRSEVLAVVGRILQKLGEYFPRLWEETRLCRFTRRLKGELLPKFGISVLRGLLEHGNRLRIEFHAPVEVRCGTHHAKYFRIIVIERLDVSLRRRKILVTFVKTSKRVTQLQPRDWVRSQGRLLLQRVLPHRFHRFLLRQIFDLGGLLDCRCASDHRIQEIRELRLAVLRFEDAHAQENSRHGRACRGCRLLCFAIDDVAELRPRGERQETRLRR